MTYQDTYRGVYLPEESEDKVKDSK